MSPEAFDFAWTQYQTLLVDKLNLLTQGTSDCPAEISQPNRRRDTFNWDNGGGYADTLAV